MKQLAHLLSSMVNKRQRRSSTHRVLIVMKNRHCYRRCLGIFRSLGMKPVKKFRSVHCICCHVHKDADITMLRKHPMVKRVEMDLPVKMHGTVNNAKMTGKATCRGEVPWGVRQIKAPLVWNRTMGSGAKIAIMDTGISKHRDLKISGGYNAVESGQPTDRNGHGTHVAGTAAALRNCSGVAGAAPRAKLFAVKVLNDKGSGSISDIIEGIEWCINNRIKVINMSFGTTENSRTLHDAVKAAYKKGIVIVASAGNHGPNNKNISYPARYPETISVAAESAARKIAYFSSRGSGLDISAPGVSILSTYLNNRYIRLSGTSMASPHVTGTVALLRSLNPSLNPGAIKTILTRAAVPIKGFNRKQQGAGRLNASAAASRLSASAAAARLHRVHTASQSASSSRKPYKISMPKPLLYMKKHSLL